MPLFSAADTQQTLVPPRYHLAHPKLLKAYNFYTLLSYNFHLEQRKQNYQMSFFSASDSQADLGPTQVWPGPP